MDSGKLRRGLGLRLSILLMLLALLSTAGLFGHWAWWLDLCAHFRWQYLGAAVLLGLLAVLLRAWGALALASLIAGCNLWLIWPTAPAATDTPGAAEQISLINANLWRDTPNTADFVAWLRLQPADIVVLQELTPAHHAAIGPMLLAQGLSEVIVVPAEDAFGIGVWSRLPVRSAQLRELGPYHLANIHAQLRTPAGHTLDLFAVHPFPPIWAAGTAARDAHLRELSAWVQEAPRESLVLAGDFNATPWSAALRELSASLQLDGGTHMHWPWPTWKPSAPLGLGWLLTVPIDHVLLRGAAMLKYELGPDTSSDHRPQRVLISVT